MISRVLRDDPESDKQIIHHYDTVDGRVVIETVQNVEDIVEMNHAESGQHSDWRPFGKGNWHKVASIPMTIYADLKKKGVLDDDNARKKWLNDPDNRVFRTMRGRI